MLKSNNITTLNKSYDNLYAEFQKEVISLIETSNNKKIILFDGYFKLLNLKNKKEAIKELFELFKSSDESFTQITIETFITNWLKICEEEIKSFLTLLIQDDGTFEKEEISYIFDWLYSGVYFDTVFTYKKENSVRDLCRKMKRKMINWTTTQVPKSSGTNIIYQLTGAEKRALRLILKHDTDDLSNIPDQDFKSFLRKDREFIIANYRMEKFWEAKDFIEEFWGNYQQKKIH